MVEQKLRIPCPGPSRISDFIAHKSYLQVVLESGISTRRSEVITLTCYVKLFSNFKKIYILQNVSRKK